MRRFTRDVLVNLLANLVAAAIIYLLGVVTKLFPAKLPLVVLALTTVAVAALAGSFARFLVAIQRGERARSRRLLYWIMIFAGIALTGLGLSVLLETRNLHAFWLIGVGLTHLACGLYMTKGPDG